MERLLRAGRRASGRCRAFQADFLIDKTTNIVYCESITRPSEAWSLCRLLSTVSTAFGNEIQTSDVCINMLQDRTKLDKNEIVKIVSSLESLGFNAVGQMYKRPNNEALDYSTARRVVEYFDNIEGVNLGRVVRNSPYILAADKDAFEKFDENKMFLTKRLNLEEKDLGRILSSNAYILSRSLDATVKPCIEYLESRGFSKEQVRSFVVRFPRCLLLSQDKLRMSESSITGLGLTGEEYSRILRKFPPIVGLAPSKIESIKKWLSEFGITTPHELRSVIVKFPQILSQNGDGKLGNIVKYMIEDLQLPKDVIKTALLSSPDVFGRNLDRIKSHVESMMAIGMTTEELRRLVYSYPGALRFNLAAEPYRSKIRFLKESLDQNPSSTLPVHPKYLSYSMDRIASRAAFLMEKNKKTSGVTAWCSPTDEIFANRFCKVSLNEWESFKERYLSGSN